MDWSKLIEKLIDRGDLIMPVFLTTGFILILPWLFPQLNSWSAIWSPYPHGWWMFVIFVFTCSFLLCKSTKTVISKTFSHFEAKPRLLAENEELQLCLKNTQSKLREIISHKANMPQNINIVINTIDEVFKKLNRTP